MRGTILVILLILITQSAKAQSVDNDLSRVKQANEIIFYGFDFSRLKLVDKNRKGQNMSRFHEVWYRFLTKYMTGENMASKLSKETVDFSLQAISKANDAVNPDSIWSEKKRTFSVNEVSGMVASYNLTEKEGIGFTMIFECMNENTKKTSLYFTFFDIATREVLWAEYVDSYDGNSYNRVEDWSMAILVAYKSRFVPIYKSKMKNLK